MAPALSLSTCDFPGQVSMHGVYLAVEVFPDDLFLLLRGGLGERG